MFIKIRKKNTGFSSSSSSWGLGHAPPVRGLNHSDLFALCHEDWDPGGLSPQSVQPLISGILSLSPSLGVEMM